jgi:transposase
MEHHTGIDVSLELSSLCVLDATGKVIREAKVASEPEALVAFLGGLGVTIVRVGLEAGPLSQWLYDGLHKAGFEAVLLETRHVKAALSAMAIKTDRRDARGIAQLLRMGWYRPVHRNFVQPGDTLVVTRIDRLARSMKDLQEIVHELKGRGVALRATEQPVDTGTAAGKAFLDMLGAFAEFETNLRRERQLEGIALAKTRGVSRRTGRSAHQSETHRPALG